MEDSNSQTQNVLANIWISNGAHMSFSFFLFPLWSLFSKSKIGFYIILSKKVDIPALHNQVGIVYLLSLR